MKRVFLIGSFIIILALAAGFIFEKETEPREDTRLILEHTYLSYIAPVCFEGADATNFLEDSDLAMAKQLDYKPHDKCTEDALEPSKDKVIISWLKSLGWIETEWSQW